MGRTEEAADLLAAEENWADLDPASLKTLLTGCAWAADSAILQTAVAKAAEILRALPGEDGQKKWDAFLAAARWLFRRRDPGPDVPERPWRLFARVPGPLGQAARLMDTAGADTAALTAEIADWTDVPAGAAARVMEQGVPLPDAFYRQSADALRETIAALASEGRQDLSALALDWTAGQDFGASLTRFQFFFDLTASALRTDPWEDRVRADALCGQFLSAAADLLPSLYSRDLLADEEDWTALPGLHRFALYALRAWTDREAGDDLGAVRALRAGLKAAPAMKKAVSHWMEQIRARI